MDKANASPTIPQEAHLPSDVAGYEQRDADTRAVLRFLIGLGVVLVVIAGLMWGWFRYLQAAERLPAPASPFANIRQVPSGPQLQVTPRQDLLKTTGDQERALESYGWENRQAGTVRIPIERAMDMLVQKGVPVLNVPVTAQPPAAQGNEGAAPNSGSAPENVPPNPNSDARERNQP
jgi:hypothetical protein